MKTWWAKLSDRTKAALHTAWMTMLGSFIPSLLGFLSDIQKWAGDTDHASFPSVNPLGKAAAAAVAGAFALVVNLIFRAIKPPPTYAGTATKVVPAADNVDRGDVTLHILLAVVAVVCGVLLIFVGVGAITINGTAGWTIAGMGVTAAGLGLLV